MIFVAFFSKVIKKLSKVKKFAKSPPARGGNPLKLTPRTRQAQLSPTAALPGFGGYCPLDAPAPFGLEAVGC